MAPSCRLRKYRILRHNREFRHVFQQAQYSKARNGIRLLACTNRYRHARIGTVVAKRHISLATQRNRIRRQILEFFRIHTCPPVDIIALVYNKTLQHKTNSFIRELLAQIWPQHVPTKRVKARTPPVATTPHNTR